jgi:hypothetical protein
MEPKAVSKMNNAVVKAHLRKCQLEEAILTSVRTLSTKINISIRYI